MLADYSNFTLLDRRKPVHHAHPGRWSEHEVGALHRHILLHGRERKLRHRAANLGITTGLNYGLSLTDRCKASPIVWKGIAYFGGTDGRFYRVRTAAGALDVLPLSARGIETTPAIEFDTTDAMDVSDVFMPAGDRLHWIDPTSGTTLTRKAISPP